MRALYADKDLGEVELRRGELDCDARVSRDADKRTTHAPLSRRRTTRPALRWKWRAFWLVSQKAILGVTNPQFTAASCGRIIGRSSLEVMKTHQAAVFHAPNVPIEIREFPEPKLAQGAARMHTTYSEVFRTDVHVHHGKLSGVPCPIIPEHVSVGVVAKMRGNIRAVEGDHIKKGDVVTFLDVHETSYYCYYCLVANQPTHCPRERVRHHLLGERRAAGWLGDAE